MIPDTNVTPTVRDKIITHLTQRFEEQVAGENGRFLTWSKVYTDPPPLKSNIIGNANLILLDGRETKQAEVQRFRCTLQMTTEFRVKLALGDRKTQLARNILGEIQSIILSDIYCGGLTLNIVERANELNVGGETDTEVSGIVFWDVQYRHAVNNPCLQI